MQRIFLGVILGSVIATSPLFAAETATPVLTQPISESKSAITTPAAKRIRVGYVDVLKVAEQSDAGKIARSHFEAKADRHKAQIDTKQKLLEKQKAALEAKLPTYTPEQRTAKIKAYEKKVNELRKLLQQADKEMKPMQEELSKEIFGKIEKTATAYGAANGFDVILEKRELLYLGDNVDVEDVSDALITEMNRTK